MNSLPDIERALKALPQGQRRRLLDWLAGELGLEMGIAEPMAKYGNTAETREILPLAEYFEMEAVSSVLHEYVAGEIYDMAEPSQAHDIIAMNLAGPLYAQLQDRPCRIYAARRQLQFKIGDDDFVYRPDVWVACGEVRDPKGEYVEEPCLVIEVLSPSTARFDRREKVMSYRAIPSIQEYVIVAQKPAQVVIYRRGEQWRPQILSSPEDTLDLRSVGLTLPVARVYRGVSAETRP